MILAVAPNTESTCLYRGKTQTNCLSQSRGVDVRDSVLITNAAIGQVESLSRYVSIWVRSVVRIEPRTPRKGVVKEDRRRSASRRKKNAKKHKENIK